jgi:hypothetical protein
MVRRKIDGICENDFDFQLKKKPILVTNLDSQKHIFLEEKRHNLGATCWVSFFNVF